MPTVLFLRHSYVPMFMFIFSLVPHFPLAIFFYVLGPSILHVSQFLLPYIRIVRMEYSVSGHQPSPSSFPVINCGKCPNSLTPWGYSISPSLAEWVNILLCFLKPLVYRSVTYYMCCCLLSITWY